MSIADRVRNPGRLGLLAAGAIIVALLVAACTSPDDNSTATGSLGNGLAGLSDAQTAELLRTAGIVAGGFSGSSTGIRVNGVGVVKASPDIAVLSMGVETFAETVTSARDEAAIAIHGMLTALRAGGVVDDDIETRFFNIQPEYTFVDVSSPDGRRIRERVLTGYRVTNTLSVTLHDLDAVGSVIDDVVTAGGDAARINSIGFTVEDGTALEEQARTLALRDAVAKADLYAAETGVARGKLVFISETSAPAFPRAVRVESAFAIADGAVPPTSILAGDTEIRVSVQAVFAID